jgi:hypothetical protein
MDLKFNMAKPPPRGFALIVTLSLMILLTVIAVGLLALSSVSLRSSTQGQSMAVAQANARLALMLALGDLQKSAGHDQRITAAADILPAAKPATTGRAQWAGVWDTSAFSPAKPDTKAFVRWLVSDTPSAFADATATASSDDVLVFTGKDPASSVRVPKIKVSDGSYAYWVADEGLKADMGWSEGKFTTDERKQMARLTAAPGPDHGSFAGPFSGKTTYPVSKSAGNPWLDNLDKALSAADMPLVMSDPSNQSTWLKSLGHDITLGNHGIMSDVKKGGLRRDLSLAFEMDGTADVTATSQPTKFNQQDGEFVGGNDRLTAPQVVTGMTVKERFLYRDTQSSGTPFSSSMQPAPSVVRGPNWWALRDYANLYKRLSGTSGNYTLAARSYYPNKSAGATSLGALSQANTGGDTWDKEYSTNPANYIYRPARGNYAPVLLGSVCLYSAIATQSNGTTAKLALGVDSLMYLWNPFNRTLKVDKFGILADYGFPGDLSFYVTKGGNTITYGPAQLAQIITANSPGPGGGAITYLVSDLTMAPGEVVVVSPSSNRSATARPLNDEAKPGTNTDNASGVILTKLPGPSGWTEVPLDLATDTVSLRYVSPSGGNNWFWLRTTLPPSGATAMSLYGYSSSTGAGDELQAIDSNNRGNNATLPEYFYPSQTAGMSVGPYAANTLVNTKNFFGVHTYLAKPASHTGKYPNPVEIFSQFNPAPVGGTVNDVWRPCHLNQIYNMVSRAGGANTLLQEVAINFPATKLNNGFWGASYSAGSTSVPMTNIPAAPIFSLAAFSHAALALRTSEPYHAVGNSWASVFVSPVSPYGKYQDSLGSHTAADSSWLLNDALFDRYYLSGIAPSFTIGAGGYSATGTITNTLTSFFSADYQSANANPVLRPYLPPGQTAAAAAKALVADDGYKKMGAYSLIDGAFNVNSTSVSAWTAFLRANRNLAIGYANGGTDGSAGSPFPSSNSPVNPGNGAAALWAGFSRLSDAQVTTLATEIVKQVKLRGPFMSLSDFVNHRAGTPKNTENDMGALQAAIEAANINSAVKTGAGGTTPDYTSTGAATFMPGGSTAGNRKTTTDIPTDITQADLLLPLAPRLAARSDTFRIRGYGEARSKDGTQILAKATCEAVVQRFPEYMDPATDATNNEPWDEASLTGTTLNPINLKFGRRFKVIKFRWLSANEI